MAKAVRHEPELLLAVDYTSSEVANYKTNRMLDRQICTGPTMMCRPRSQEGEDTGSTARELKTGPFSRPTVQVRKTCGKLYCLWLCLDTSQRKCSKRNDRKPPTSTRPWI